MILDVLYFIDYSSSFPVYSVQSHGNYCQTCVINVCVMCTCSMVSEIDYLIQKLIFHGYFNEYVSWQLTRYKHLFKSTPVQQKH